MMDCHLITGIVNSDYLPKLLIVIIIWNNILEL